MTEPTVNANHTYCFCDPCAKKELYRAESYWMSVVAKKVEDAKVLDTGDDWHDGFNTALDWVLRILRKDKSAS